MKKIFAILAVVLATVTISFASETNRDENGNIQRGAYSVGKSFLDNWYFEAQGGAIVIFAPKMGQGIASDFNCLKPQENFGFNLGKDITPVVGLRLGYQGFKTSWREPRFWNTQHQSMHHVHFDVMFNITNAIGGYKTNRVYNCIPYVMAGMIWQNSDHSGHNDHLGIGAGIENSFRVCRWFAITADLRYIGTTSEALGKTYMSYEDKAKIGGYFSAQLGLKFTVREGFDRTKTVVKVATASYKSEIDDLKQQIAELQARKPITKTDTVIVKEIVRETVIEKMNNLLNAPTMFEQGSAHIRPIYESLLMQVASGLDKDKVYEITGYTSPEGSREINERLRILRPQAVKKFLVKKLGFKDKNIIVRAASEEENAGSAIRAAIIREFK